MRASRASHAKRITHEVLAVRSNL